MKIAIFSDLYAFPATGGIPSSIRAQKKALEKMGHEVVVFSPGEKNKKNEKNLVIVPTHQFLNINHINLAKRPAKIEKFILQKIPDFYRFDLVHVHYEASCSVAGMCLARRFGLPLVQTMHGREDQAIAINVSRGLKNFVAIMLNFLHSRYFLHLIKIKKDTFSAPTFARVKMWELMVNHAEQADFVLVPSEHFKKKIKQYGVSKNIQKVSNGISKDILCGDFKQRNWDEREPLKLIWNSRVSKEKRIIPFLEALKGVSHPYVLEVYGNGNELNRAKKFVNKNNLNVFFRGHRERSEIIESMKKSHLAIMASYDFDTQGMTLLEAQATGLPVFFCDPAMKEVVPDGSYILASGPTSMQMAQALNSVSGAQIASMSSVMLNRRNDVFAKESAEKLLAIYGQLR